MKKGLFEAKLNAFAFTGFYVRITIRNVDLNIINNHPKDSALILSSLLKHERKISQLHFQVKKRVEFADLEIKSKESLYFHVGFRKFDIAPIYSRVYAVVH